VALSLATTAEMKMDGNRLFHGALIPQFIWILDDGEIRVGGQQFGPGLLASLNNGAVASEIGRYFAPEYRSTGLSSKSTDVYSMGAILYLLLTGAEPPDALTSSAFSQAVRAAKTPSGAAVPDDLRAILDKSLAVEPSSRFASIADMKQSLSALAHSGKYSATTFNLAFYVSNLLKKEMEGESIDRERENKVNLAPYLEEPPQRDTGTSQAPVFASVTPERKSRMPLAIAAGVAIVAVGAGAFYMFGSHQNQVAPPTTTVVAAQTLPPQPKPAPVTQPLVASTGTATDPATTSAVDEAARKKAFEEAVQQKLQEEMSKLQQDYLRQLKQSQSKNAPVQVAASEPPPAAPARAVTREETPSAAQLDQQRRPETQTTAPTVPQPSAAIAQTQPSTPQPQPQPAAAPTVREGDVVDMNELDATPRIVRAVSPAYPPIALSQRIQTTIFVSVLISERGDVADVKVLKGDKRFGFEDAALRAVRAIRFTPPTKDGKRVKTWFAIPIKFTL
jgi:TonB family protein